MWFNIKATDPNITIPYAEITEQFLCDSLSLSHACYMTFGPSETEAEIGFFRSVKNTVQSWVTLMVPTVPHTHVRVINHHFIALILIIGQWQ